MNQLKHNLAMYAHLIRMAVRSMLQYKADFLSSLIGVILLNGANIAQISIISWKFKSIASWATGDLMMLYGFYMVCWSFFSILFNKIYELEREITEGTFDKYLFRPMNVFLQFIGGEIKYVGLCDTILGILLIAIGKGMSDIVWSLGDYLLLPFFVLCGGIIIVCVNLILASISFWVTKSSPLFSMLMQITMLTQKYPISIFGSYFSTFVTVLLPIGFMNYYPTAYLMHKPDASPLICLLAPVVALLFTLIASVVWKKGIKHYGSAGG